MTQYFLAVDGGGTKTDVVCSDKEGNVIGKGLSGPTNLTTTSVGAASFNLIEAVRQATENLPKDDIEFAVLVMGLAGLDSQKEEDEAYRIFTESLKQYEIKKFILVNDSLIALESGTKAENAVIMISGTGSICYGKNSQGETARTSGMDFLLTDQGSGYAIGRMVLREAVKSFDGRIKKSILEKLVCEYFRITSISELKNEVYNPPLTKIEIADLAHLFSKAYENNDEAALRIFEKICYEIVLMVSTIVEKLDLNKSSFDCVFAGAVTKLPSIRAKIKEALTNKFSNLKPIFPEIDPVFGALKIALRN